MRIYAAVRGVLLVRTVYNTFIYARGAHSTLFSRALRRTELKTELRCEQVSTDCYLAVDGGIDSSLTFGHVRQFHRQVRTRSLASRLPHRKRESIVRWLIHSVGGSV